MGFRSMRMPHPLGHLQAMLPHQPTHPLFGGAQPGKTQLRPDLTIAFPVKGRGGQNTTDLGDQHRVCARPQRTAFARRGRCAGGSRSQCLALRIHRRARNMPDSADPLQPITATGGHRAGLAQGFDDRPGKGRPHSSLSILCSNRSLAIVNSPTFAWSRWISSSWPSAGSR